MRHIGKYEIRGMLGQGGMGKVYKARLPVVGKLVALKVLAPWEMTEVLLGQDGVRELFEHEARTLAALRHPHLAQILDFDTDSQGRPFFTQEFYCRHLGLVLGETDSESPTARVLPPERATRYALEMLQGLERLHWAGIVHRDMKPGNVLLGEDDRVKLIDLGLSLLPDAKQRFPAQFKVGTPLYAAPEQEYDPASVTPSADLYSVGVCLWRMLTGAGLDNPGSGSPLPSVLRPALGTCWDEVLRTAVAPEPSKRHPSVAALSDDLQEALACWHRTHAQTCLLPEHEASISPPQAKWPRRRKAKVSRKEAERVFGLDRRGQPQSYAEQAFTAEGPGEIRDPLRDLVWEQSGSPYPLNRREAWAYVQTRNRDTGRVARPWRLPTVNELLTQVVPPDSHRDICQSPLFDPERCQLWSADVRTELEGWYVDTELGFVAAQDKHCRCFVRLVREREEQ